MDAGARVIGAPLQPAARSDNTRLARLDATEPERRAVPARAGPRVSRRTAVTLAAPGSARTDAVVLELRLEFGPGIGLGLVW